ncbi:tight adherence protein B [Dyella jiangningensis]|uniref:type II secretion system F family protein n=1 Tax=Dyella sp. AtDHG13 TaxID=1938897 RepID=UPI000880FCC4|nr:type II secretion system F family protein [Dyella sp. AtDHG13]PXV55338.1 tight adherence protein B [Dyella sp. AtDHG13]SDK80233.1 tight adherence protein B [Dyella jiangningensis]
MIQALALAALALLLLAGAIELWWGSALRLQHRKSMENIEQRLVAHAPAERRTMPPRLPGQRKRALLQRADGLLMRADLPANRAIYAVIAGGGVLLALVAWWRIGSALAMPLVLGLYGALVWLWLRRRIEKQQQKLLAQLPDFLDGMIRMTSVGNSLPMAFQSTTKSVAMPLRRVLDRTLSSMHAGADLDQALAMASRPYHLEELSLLHAVFGIGMRVGGRADHILQRMSDFMRDHAHARAELKAITSETRMSAWVLALLPVAVSVFMTMVDPAFFKPMFHEPLGHRFLLIALALEVSGGLLLYRLAKSL